MKITFNFMLGHKLKYFAGCGYDLLQGLRCPVPEVFSDGIFHYDTMK